jgi:hypothetical protein
MMFSGAFCCREFGQQFRSWKRQEESRSASSAELRDVVFQLCQSAVNGPMMDWSESLILSIS